MNKTEALKFYHDEVEKIKADGVWCKRADK